MTETTTTNPEGEDALAAILDLFPKCDRCGAELTVGYAMLSPDRPRRVRCRLAMSCDARRLGGTWVPPKKDAAAARAQRSEPNGAAPSSRVMADAGRVAQTVLARLTRNSR
jgi:hypothetical protein